MTTSHSEPSPEVVQPEWRPLMTAEQHRKQAELLLKRGGEENGALALHHEQIACLIDARNGKGKAEDAWNEADHPRGQPGNAGQFGSGGGRGRRQVRGGGSARSQPLEMILQPKFRTKTEHVKHLLTKEGGTTVAEVLKATGWPSVSMPQMARVLGMRLEKVKEGGITKYRGIPLTEAEKAEQKKATEEAKKQKAEAERQETEREAKWQEMQEQERKARERDALLKKAEEYEKKVREQTEKRRATREAKKAQAQQAKATGKIRIEGTASAAHTRTVTEALDQLPEGVRKAIEANGAYIKLGETMITAFPHLKDVQPPGYPPGSTWENSGGLYSWGPRVIGMPEKYRVMTWDGKQGGLTDKGLRAAATLRHEVGHAYDHALGKGTGDLAYSQTPAFQDAYKADKAKHNKFDEKNLAYYRQDPPNGAMEAFAEVFACIHANKGRGGGGSGGDDIRRKFPEVTKLMASIAHG